MGSATSQEHDSADIEPMVLHVEELLQPNSEGPGGAAKCAGSQGTTLFVLLDGKHVSGGNATGFPSDLIYINPREKTSLLQLRLTARHEPDNEKGKVACSDAFALESYDAQASMKELASLGAPLYTSLWLGLAAKGEDPSLFNCLSRACSQDAPRVRITILGKAALQRLPPTMPNQSPRPNVRRAILSSTDEEYSCLGLHPMLGDLEVGLTVQCIEGLVRCLDESNNMVGSLQRSVKAMRDDGFGSVSDNALHEGRASEQDVRILRDELHRHAEDAKRSQQAHNEKVSELKAALELSENKVVEERVQWQLESARLGFVNEELSCKSENLREEMNVVSVNESSARTTLEAKLATRDADIIGLRQEIANMSAQASKERETAEADLGIVTAKWTDALVQAEEARTLLAARDTELSRSRGERRVLSEHECQTRTNATAELALVTAKYEEARQARDNFESKLADVTARLQQASWEAGEAANLRAEIQSLTAQEHKAKAALGTEEIQREQAEVRFKKLEIDHKRLSSENSYEQENHSQLILEKNTEIDMLRIQVQQLRNERDAASQQFDIAAVARSRSSDDHMKKQEQTISSLQSRMAAFMQRQGEASSCATSRSGSVSPCVSPAACRISARLPTFGASDLGMVVSCLSNLSSEHHHQEPTVVHRSRSPSVPITTGKTIIMPPKPLRSAVSPAPPSEPSAHTVVRRSLSPRSATTACKTIVVPPKKSHSATPPAPSEPTVPRQSTSSSPRVCSPRSPLPHSKKAAQVGRPISNPVLTFQIPKAIKRED